MSKTHPRMLSVTQAAARIGVSRQYIHALMQQKKFQTAQRIGWGWFIDETEVDTMAMERSSREATKSPSHADG